MYLDEVKRFLEVDFDDDDSLIQELIEVSEIYVDECVGENYKTEPKLEKLANLLKKRLIRDMYENRNTEVKSLPRDRIFISLIRRLED